MVPIDMRSATTQASLFDDEGGPTGITAALVVSRNAAPLTKEQKQFNKLIARIDATRRELAQWQAYLPAYQQRVAAEIVPLNALLREKRIALVMLLDQAMDGKVLTKGQKVKVADLLVGQLSDLLAEVQEAELVRLYDKYSAVSFEDEQQDNLEFMRAFASDAFGVELGADTAASTPEELARLIGEKMHAGVAGAAPQPEGRHKRKKSAKAEAQQMQREQAAAGASKAVREVYRKLASQLHPDREPDLEQRARKTGLMQEVNQAYAASDLLALLELQLRVEQIDPAALANMAQERLAHYNLVLREQSQRLEEELFELMAPFEIGMGNRLPRKPTPDAIDRLMDVDIRHLQTTLRGLKADLLSFQDINQLKSSLKHYRVSQPDDDETDFLDSLILDPFPTRRRR